MDRKTFWAVVFAAGFIGYLIGDQPDTVTSDATSRINTSIKSSFPETTKLLRKPQVQKRVEKSPSKITNKPVEKPQSKSSVSVTMYVDASRLNVRNLPTKEGKQIWTLKRNEKVSVTNRDGDWLFVQGSRYSGWVFGTYLTPKPSVQIAKRQVTINTGLSISEIKQTLIKRSHAYYRGNCPCPYNITSAGRRCGGRSAYSRPGGASPLCYESDVSEAMVAEYQARQ
jgi:hypothetical protein